MNKEMSKGSNSQTSGKPSEENKVEKRENKGNGFLAEKPEDEMETRKISASSLNGGGKSNLAFVPEEEEDGELSSMENYIESGENQGKSEEKQVNGKNTPEKTKEFGPSTKKVDGEKENDAKNNNNHQGKKGNGNVGNLGVAEMSNGDRRRSSAEMIRQSRAYKRISRAITQINFYNQNINYELSGMSEEELLSKLFDLFDYNQHQKLCQDEWIEFLKSRLCREERQVDFVEVLESVTYAVCGDEDVSFEQFSVIFRTKNVLNKFFRLIDRDLDGIVTADQVMDFISQFSSARSSSRLTKENIKWLEKLFRQYVGDGKEIRKEDFNKIIQTKNQFFTDRVFDIFDKDASGSISLHEFLDAMHQFAGTEPDDKIRFLFKVYDVDGDGVIQCEELGKVMRACMEENGMRFSDDQIDELTLALFEDADVEKRGALSYEALKAQLEKHSGLLENLSISIERWLVPPKPEPDARNFKTKIEGLIPHQFSLRYIRNNYVYLVWLLIFILTNMGLFISKSIKHRANNPDHTVYIVLARGAGQCLNFNCTFIVIVMLRQCLTFLRARGASMFLPIDQHIYFHKMTGWLIFLFSILHTVMHLINIDIGMIHKVNDDCLTYENCSNPNLTYVGVLFDPAKTNMGLIPGYAFNSGVVLMIILTLMVICSLPFVRRGGCFEVFYWTHLLYFAFWVLLIIHAPNFWRWFIVPGVIFLIEQALRYYHWRMGRGRTSVRSGILLPSKVTHLYIRRPPNFEFHPGDYVFVRIPRIAKYEWHPFTISSAPEQSDELCLHIRAAGQWTTRLFEYFENEIEKMNCIGYEECGMHAVADKTKQKYEPYATIQEEMEDVGIMNDKSRKVDSKLTEQRQRLPTVGVGDSHSTVNPSSSSSSLNENESANDVFTSIDSINETDAIIKKKKLPIRLNKPKLTSTKSLPNVHERMLKREIKLNLMNANTQFKRSLSVNSMENKSAGNGKSPTSAPNLGSTRRIQRVPMSFRYMRNKPTVIALKTPSYEEQRDELLPAGCNDRAAEEGRNASKGCDGEAYERDTHPISGITRSSREELAIGRPLEIYLDGPYGAPSSHIFRAEHAVLIATGIGVTPFASILQSIMLRYWASRVNCPNCNFTWCGDLPQSVLNLKKVDFFWINRDQRSFEWFVHLLSQLEIEQAELGGAMERFLDMHMYITSALQRTDMKAVGLQLALDLLHEKEKRDLITGLKTRTNAGRPNWNKIFKQLADQHKGKVTVFYCGPPTLARSLKVKCDEFGFSFRKELF